MFQNYGGGMRPPLNALMGPGMPGINMGPAGGRPWPNPPNNNSVSSQHGMIIDQKSCILNNVNTNPFSLSLQIPYSSASPGSYSVGNVVLSY